MPFILSAILAIAACFNVVAAAPKPLATAPVAVPTPQQLAWLDLEVGSMITWNLQTICTEPGPHAPLNTTSQVCQVASSGNIPTRSAIAQWNPKNLDTDEWARISKLFGAKYIVLVADHMTGFALWDTKAHDYSIAHTQYKGGGGDVVREMIASAKKYGLKLGVFYSVHFNWFLGVNDFEVGWPPLGPKAYSRAEFLEVAEVQLTELAELFDGELFELWFDGGLGPLEEEVGDMVARVMPGALCHGCTASKAGPIRWCGNEGGTQALPSWAALDKFNSGNYVNGNPFGKYFFPPSADTVLRDHWWFWVNGTEATIKPTKALVAEYLMSVGRSSNLILNVAPDPTGAIPPLDTTQYAQMGEAIECLFSKRLARQPAEGVEAPGGGSAAPIVMNAETGVMEPIFELPAPLRLTNATLVLREDQRAGQLVGNFTVECRSADSWEACPLTKLPPVFSGETPIAPGIGHKRMLGVGVGEAIAATEGAKAYNAIRVVVQDHFAVGAQRPTLRDLELFDWSGDIKGCDEGGRLDDGGQVRSDDETRDMLESHRLI